MAASSSLIGSSAVMAAGTMVSRLSGFVRSALLVAALGNLLHADLFNIANTVPNMLYILLAGGVFNAVLVPQLVRSMRNDQDGGDAYTNRIVTLAGVFLLVVTAVLVVAAPLLMRLFLNSSFYEPDMAAQRESVIVFARYCLPQVFFYGMFVLVGQILNARGSFGPMMWAPIANNVISVGVLVVYLLVFGPAAKGDCGGYTSSQELLLGLGSTIGIALQFLILVPYLRKAGFTFRPRFDFRRTGLGHTLRLGVWTVLFVVVNQIAYTVVVNLASSGTAAAATSGLAACHSGASADATGYTVYSYAFLLVMVPHSIVTVSLATAVLPRLAASAAEGDLSAVGSTIASTLRTTLALIVPFVLVLPVVATSLAHVVFGFGAGSTSYDNFAPSLALFAPGLLCFTVHYLVLRGFYALERNRTVFWVQCAVAATNIVLAVLLVAQASARDTSPALIVAYTGSYLVGSLVSYLLLRSIVGGLDTALLVRFLVRLGLAAGLSTGVAWLVARGLDTLVATPGKPMALLTLVLVLGVDAAVLLVLARIFRITEVTSVVELVSQRLPLTRNR
jgi:putative peptidoglycan lipid II flippase